MKWVRSFGFAFNGLKAAWADQRNFRIHVWTMALVLALAFFFQVQPWEWCAIILSGGLVIGLELMNTALESATDLITVERNPLAGKVKDVAASAVLIAALAATAVGVIIFSKYFYTLYYSL